MKHCAKVTTRTVHKSLRTKPGQALRKSLRCCVCKKVQKITQNFVHKMAHKIAQIIAKKNCAKLLRQKACIGFCKNLRKNLDLVKSAFSPFPSLYLLLAWLVILSLWLFSNSTISLLLHCLKIVRVMPRTNSISKNHIFPEVFWSTRNGIVSKALVL